MKYLILFLFLIVNTTVKATDTNVMQYDSVRVTYYYPTGHKTADGHVIDPNHVKNWCAVSRDLLHKYPFGRTIEIEGLGKFVVRDATNKRIKNTVDILLPKGKTIKTKRRRIWLIK